MKEKTRKKLLLQRKALSKTEILKKSSNIKEKLFGLKKYKDAKTVLFYISYNGEVFTHDMIRQALKDKKVVVPISNKEDFSLSLSELKSWDDLEISSYDILEPKKDCVKEISIDEIDLIIVPGVGFDLKGNRLGHGKGYYDRLLEKTKAKTVGLAFEFQIVENIPTDSNDVPVDIIVTEERIIEYI